ncbi:MAG: preprotein translocase, SecA subunit [Gammaproteobacteria bacterium]|jgi:preprotein translocase subunit SecA|nr:preprotein translocase, SecA subunit [Gammaproteobacteria bacterium]
MALTNIVKQIFGSRNDRILRRLYQQVARINALEGDFKALSDEDIKAKTTQFKERFAKGESLDSLLPEAFAAAREASSRVLGLRHFDVQLIGGMVLHEGNIAEMLTGEGKTLMATLAAYLNALTGRGVHIITVNDYLAKRDAQWMEPIYQFLGLTVGVNLSQISAEEKHAAYLADITYGTNNEFGFDYLRDNMAFSLQNKVQRGNYFAIVDEVDSILIDEARTPLIISGPSEGGAELYSHINKIAPQLTRQASEDSEGDFYVDEKAKQVFLSEAGHAHIEKLLAEANLIKTHKSLYDIQNVMLMHHVNAALRAHFIYQRDVDYVVKENEIFIVDEHTGRLMIGRRWSDGLHQAVEAKEGVPVQNENQTLASITFQNYFRLYEKLAGMTGTADTEAYEFHQIYDLEVIAIPPNKAVARVDYPDKVYMNREEKFKAVVAEIKECVARQQPVLVGTISIEISEYLSKLLAAEKIKHEVLNAKQHEREASIIAEAGRPGAVTIATNMAGRGTDIVLGGQLSSELANLTAATAADITAHTADWQKRHEIVVAAGGLHVLGTERHESRRIDNQLRGRSGRQGDPGSSRFYLAMDDNLLRIFASEKVAGFISRLGQPDEAMEHPMLSRIIAGAQRKVEGFNFDIRKQLLEYDDVANEQRKVIYEQRNSLLAAEDVSETIRLMLSDVTEETIEQFIAPGSFAEEWAIESLEAEFKTAFHVILPINDWLAADDQLNEEGLRQKIKEVMANSYENKWVPTNADVMRHIEKSVLLQQLDQHWKEHLATMDYLRQGIHLRGYAQKNPKQEYKREAFELFGAMLKSLRYDTISNLMQLEVPTELESHALEEQHQHNILSNSNVYYLHADIHPEESMKEDKTLPFSRSDKKIGRNDACPCGSGRKFKQCHGAVR